MNPAKTSAHELLTVKNVLILKRNACNVTLYEKVFTVFLYNFLFPLNIMTGLGLGQKFFDLRCPEATTKELLLRN